MTNLSRLGNCAMRLRSNLKPAIDGHEKAQEWWTPSFGQENAEIKLGSQALLD